MTGASDISPKPLFTVFTGTRNRAHTLPRVYDSLCRQTLRDFEWLIVDNESTDGTRELVEGWQKEADFPIRYFWHENRGKHGSQNRAIGEARGELFVTLDSDDPCAPNALERFSYHWQSIPADQRARYSGVTSHTLDDQGRINGTAFPLDPTDSDSLEIRYRHRVTGEKWGFQRTDVMREFPLPEIAGYTGLMPSSITWNAIARRYRMRFVNEALKTWSSDQAGSLSRPGDRIADAPGAMIEAQETINHDLRWLPRAPLRFYLKAAKFSRSAFHVGIGLPGQAARLTSTQTRLLWLAALPVGLGVYVAERLRVARYLPGPAERNIGR